MHLLATGPVTQDVVDSVLGASRAPVGGAGRSPGAAEEVALARNRALVLRASCGPRRVLDLAEALTVDHKGPITRERPQDTALVPAPRAFSDAAGEARQQPWSLGWRT